MTSTTKPTPTERRCAYEYTVKRGDSFYLIAHRLGIPLRDLLEANSDVNPARLMVGDVLCIPMEEDDAPAADAELPADPEGSLDEPAQPAPDAGATTCEAGSRHVVAEGETVSDVQIREGLNRHTLELANPTVDLDALSAGDSLCVPPVNVPCSVTPTRILGEDDTLESAALMLNVSVGALLRANPCLAPADFRSGACINVPQR